MMTGLTKEQLELQATARELAESEFNPLAVAVDQSEDTHGIALEN